MNKLLFLLIVLMPFSYSLLIYTIDTDRAGFSSVVLSLEGQSSANVTLPGDAKNFRIVGGSYKIINSTAVVLSGASGLTTFSFSSEFLTSKTSTGWKLAFSPSENALVQVYMPPYATIESSYPQPKKVSSEDSRTIMELESSNPTTIYYRLGEKPQTSLEEDQTHIYLLAAAIIIAAVVIAVSLQREPKEISPPPEKRKPTLKITPGKKEMMETFNSNDIKIVNHLIEEQGKSKRNVLERKTGISKSSLAMALNRLEKRKIIEIDRGSTTHFVKLSDYFLKL